MYDPKSFPMHDIFIQGIQFDQKSSFQRGARLAPPLIREALFSGSSNLFAENLVSIDQPTIVDQGDFPIIDYLAIERIAEEHLNTGAKLLTLGGDHSITYPCIRAFERLGQLDIVQIDAHLDWVDAGEGIRYANGRPMRRAMEHDFVRNMAQIGIRDVRSREHEFRTAEAAGSRIFTRQQVRERGVPAILDNLPVLGNVYVSIDIDGSCPSIAPGTGSPTVDGLLYHEVRSLVQGLAQRGNVVGFDVVEVNPMVDVNGQTSLLASTLIIEFLGAIFDAKR